MHACAIFLELLSPEYLCSENCKCELQLAAGSGGYGKPLLVLKLPGADCPPIPSAGRWAAAMAAILAGQLWLEVAEGGSMPEAELLRSLAAKGVVGAIGGRDRGYGPR